MHGKGSLLSKMPGDRWQQFANLRSLYAWMWAHPGKQLLFMGGEIAQEREWSEERSLDWHLLDDDLHRGVQTSCARSNARRSGRARAVGRRLHARRLPLDRRQRRRPERVLVPALRPDGHAAGPSRASPTSRPVPRHGYRLGLPTAGRWARCSNTDAAEFGGSGVGNREVWTDDVAWHGHPQSVAMTLPPLGVVYLAPG